MLTNRLNHIERSGVQPVEPWPGATPLHFAAICGQIAAVEQLVTHHGIDPNIVDEEEGASPLHAAALGWHHEIVRALLAAGARTVLTPKDDTPLMLIVGNPAIANRTVADFNRTATALAVGGDPSWDYLPSSCPGLETALLPVWQGQRGRLPSLFRHLTPACKPRSGRCWRRSTTAASPSPCAWSCWRRR